MTDSRPQPFSLVIPAHQEEGTIGRCLQALGELLHEESVEVVVAANGCTDRTVDVARAFPVRVLDLPIGNKAAALNAADAVCASFPRIYLDADVVLDAASVRHIVAALRTDPPTLATPRPRTSLGQAGIFVRAYYRAWRVLQEVRGDHLGTGVYAVNAAGRSRWASFPHGIADDYHVHTRFRPDERKRVPHATSVVRPPRTIRSLLAVRARVYAGNVEHRSSRGTMERSRPSWGVLVRDPLAVAALPVYVIVTVVSKARARRRLAARSTDWARDESAR